MALLRGVAPIARVLLVDVLADLGLVITLSPTANLLLTLWKKWNCQLGQAEGFPSRFRQVVRPLHYCLAAMCFLLWGVKMWVVPDNVIELAPLFLLLIQCGCMHSTSVLGGLVDLLELIAAMVGDC